MILELGRAKTFIISECSFDNHAGQGRSDECSQLKSLAHRGAYLDDKSSMSECHQAGFFYLFW